LLALAEPTLRRIADKTGESAFIGTLVESDIQYLAKALSPQEVRYDASLTQRRPVYCTSIGLAILAHLEAPAAQKILKSVKIVKITPNTITDPAAINRMLERASRCGFAEVKDANLLGASGVAAPIFGPRGEVIAALSIGAPTSRYSKARKELARRVVDEAASLSRVFAGRRAPD
jgi:DNA-binding IclR family transcriptional regulator